MTIPIKIGDFDHNWQPAKGDNIFQTFEDPRGEVFGPRYGSDMLTLVGVYQDTIYRGAA